MKLYLSIIKIILAVLIATLIGNFLLPYIKDEVLNIKVFSIITLAIFVFGVLFSLFRIVSVYSKLNWIAARKMRNKVTSVSINRVPSLFSDISKKLDLNKDEKLTIQEYKNSIKFLDFNFSNQKDAGIFLIRLCFTIGILGAFYCILMAVSSISDIFSNNLNLNSSDSVEALSELQKNLSEPLKYLKNSFSISFLGIYLSCILSYIDRQAFVVEGKFLNYAENWLLSCTNQEK